MKMKNNHLLCLSVFMLALAVCPSCKKEKDFQETPDPYVPADPTEITVKATIALSDSRKNNAALVTNFCWSEADSIGIVMQRNESVSSESYALQPSSLSSDGRNAQFTGALRWEKNALQHNFYAYYPKVAGAAGAAQIPVTIPAVQTQAGGSYEHLKAYSTLVASPAIVIAPKDITDVEQNKSVSLDFISAFAVIEFRFASFWREGLGASRDDATLKISKVTLTSDGGSFAVTGGTLDLTNPDFSTSFAHISGGVRASEVALNITDPLTVPLSEKMSIISGDDASKPANLEITFPASLTVLPNINAQSAGAEEKWTAVVETDKGTFTRTAPRRNMRPGEKYIIEQVLIAFDTAGLNLGGDPVDNTPGLPWNGDVTAPPAEQVDNDAKTVTIKEPGELAWLAQVVNRERNPELGVDTFFRGYTVVLDNNIHLGDREWTPIGKAFESGKENVFKGIFDGQGRLISNFKITSTNNAEFLYAGLFGYSGAQAIRNLRVQDATITLNSLAAASIAYVGGIVGYAPSLFPVSISNCSFSGTITVNYGAHSWSAGGICGSVNSGSITACQSSVKITGTNTITGSICASIGGIVGYANGVKIKDCLFEEKGEVEGIGYWYAGGIAGNIAGSSAIVASKNAGTIKCNGGEAIAGGIVGLGRADVIACYNTGSIAVAGGTSIYDHKGVGGVAGSLYSGKTLKGCYSTGTVGRTANFSSRAGNVIGWYEPVTASIAYKYDNIHNNYFAPRSMTGDAPSNIGLGRITQFAADAWPSQSMDGWGVGNGASDNTYWNKDFPTSYGTSYPTLHWEVVY
jgi:hypothetical protein